VSAFTSNRCQATTASTAEQALELLAGDPYDLVVSDIKMPGLSGLDLLRAIKGKQPGTPVVLITGVPSVNSAVFGLRHGAYDYLPKPFSVTEVNELIQRVRRDRAEGNGNVNYPAGLNEELARRQVGVEVLSGIGELALQGLEPSVFIDKVLEKTIRSLRGDGAVILEQGRVSRFGTHLPLSKATGSVRGHGTRHSAALGLSELCDALCLVVSEEKGTISYARHGQLITLKSAADCEKLLLDFIQETGPSLVSRSAWWREALLRNPWEKIFSAAVPALPIVC